MLRPLKRLSYRTLRALVRLIVRPVTTGLHLTEVHENCIYALPSRSLSDLLVLDIVCKSNGLPSPLSAIDLGEVTEARRFFFLTRASQGLFAPTSMTSLSNRMVRITSYDETQFGDAELQSVQVFWGRAPTRDRSFLRLLVSENWAVTSRLRRLFNMIFSRHDIVVHFGQPMPLCEVAAGEPARAVRRVARLLRVLFRNQRVATMGPDFSHRRTLVHQIVRSRAVQDVIKQLSAQTQTKKLNQRARKAALTIASDMSYPTIRALSSLLDWFWRHIYSGVSVNGIQEIARLAETHTIVYVPSHRSHVDYLLLSFCLYREGLMLPHIAAGDNLNLPVLGSILRRGGAFYMRRSFRDDPLYAAVFSEYLYQVLRRGHSLEFFPEGGRSRTGRLLPARTGLLKSTLEHAQRGLPRPLAFAPVYFGYEKLIEASSYLDELRGAEKKKESVFDLFRSLRLIRQNYGHVEVNFARPILAEPWLKQPNQDLRAAMLGELILNHINERASINPVNLVAMVTLATPKLAVEYNRLKEQLECYLDLLKRDAQQHSFTVTGLSAEEIISYVIDLGMLQTEDTDTGPVLSHDPFSAVMMTWYRNNTSHTLAMASLIACLILPRRKSLPRASLLRMIEVVYPFLAAELHTRNAPEDAPRWLAHLIDAGLIIEHDDNGLAPPPVTGCAHFNLHMLANLVMPALERQYIVISLLAAPGSQLNRKLLQVRSQQVARRMSRIFGLNSPEFFDQRLFNTFVDQLIEQKVVLVRDDETLQSTPIIDDVLRASERIINPEFRYTILRD